MSLSDFKDGREFLVRTKEHKETLIVHYSNGAFRETIEEQVVDTNDIESWTEIPDF